MENQEEGNHPYEDIIQLKHYVSSTHKHMAIYDRAAQFAPFAALTGYEGKIKETARLTDQRIELSEDEKTILNNKLFLLKEQIDIHPEIEIVYFQKDEKKSGGAYITVKGMVKKLNEYQRSIELHSGVNIFVEAIVDISGEIFKDIELW